MRSGGGKIPGHDLGEIGILQTAMSDHDLPEMPPWIELIVQSKIDQIREWTLEEVGAAHDRLCAEQERLSESIESPYDLPRFYRHLVVTAECCAAFIWINLKADTESFIDEMAAMMVYLEMGKGG